ncbi:NUDIX domain-containing protein [Bacillus aquiflavi]|uniref:NUDIX domain-containing protein n=1 Tax=Bacillus aquiflavi TaxID=2672567 RepID=A0A6B3VQG0_9BACI|nr:NUDIX domain-containing protein [Bacillus aquiflavi]MBA4536177.1 NUDIX domain-containing protein [Bacillus aquiflavi]NEY80550.1 NUDIX domain-containing protein [Bacillus aquiflavi]UAC46986.1 NUDIX domain-containing protein [Bacillus aquiflavi]
MVKIDEIRPGVAVIMIDKEETVLLQKRSDVGLWGIPSGHVEPGETIAQAAIREMKEELNLNIRIVKLIGVYSEPNSQIFKYPNGRTVHFVTTCFLAEIIGGELKCNSSESLDVKFFPITDLPSDLLNMHPRWLEDALANNERSFIR